MATPKKKLNDATVDEWTKASLNAISDRMLREDDVGWQESYAETRRKEKEALHETVAKLRMMDSEWPENVRPDMVNKPEHYNQGGIECIDYIEQTLGDGFGAYLQGNVVKYLHRWKYKGGVEDLKKAQWYLNKMVSHET